MTILAIVAKIVTFSFGTFAWLTCTISNVLQRLSGLVACVCFRGGSDNGLIAYWTTKALCYGTAIAAAGTVVIAAGGAAGAFFIRLWQNLTKASPSPIASSSSRSLDAFEFIHAHDFPTK